VEQAVKCGGTFGKGLRWLCCGCRGGRHICSAQCGGCGRYVPVVAAGSGCAVLPGAQREVSAVRGVRSRCALHDEAPCCARLPAVQSARGRELGRRLPCSLHSKHDVHQSGMRVWQGRARHAPLRACEPSGAHTRAGTRGSACAADPARSTQAGAAAGQDRGERRGEQRTVRTKQLDVGEVIALHRQKASEARCRTRLLTLPYCTLATPATR